MSPNGRSETVAAAIHAHAGRILGWLLCGMAVFSPWAFGVTQPWSITVMNVGGWALGVLFLARRFTAYSRTRNTDAHAGSPIIFAAGLLTILLLLYSLASAWNAAAVYVPGEWRLESRPHIEWLPHSFDANSSWKAFWSYLALAGVFWGAWDWVGEVRSSSASGVPRPTSRLRLLLWILAINGAVLALEAILQRTSGTPNLLWIMPTRVNKDALTQFGPFPYRANGAQYLNLLWPVALGFWWWLHREATHRASRSSKHHVLLPCVALMAAGALFSLSRGGVAVAVLMLAATCVVFALRRGVSASQRWGIILFIAGTAAAGLWMSWDTLGRRLQATASDPLLGRREIYETARQMAADYRWFGTGPGTFDALFQMYRQSPEQYWAGQVHDDWLEFRITLGRVGLMMALAALAVAWGRCLFAGGMPRDNTFLAMVSLALAGCLLHAKFDFPFQVYSIEFLFLLFLAVVFSSSRETGCKHV